MEEATKRSFSESKKSSKSSTGSGVVVVLLVEGVGVVVANVRTWQDNNVEDYGYEHGEADYQDGHRRDELLCLLLKRCRHRRLNLIGDLVGDLIRRHISFCDIHSI